MFGETVTFGRLLETVTDPAERLTLLASNLEDQIATVFRQIAMNRFEHAMHTARREEGELSIERLGELWSETQTAMLGDSVELTPGYLTWWSYIPHFIGTPGYVYAYAYGQLLALSVYARYEEEGSGFVPRYLDLLRAGGSKSPEELGQMVGIDLADPQFWDRGLDIIERRLEATIEAATAAGETRMTYRVIQWSTGNVGRHALRCIARHPDLELVGLWVHSPDKAGRDAGEIAGIGPPACWRRTTSTSCSRSTPIASPTPRPPTSGRATRSRTWCASSRRARTSCRARSCRSSTRRTCTPTCAEARDRVRDGGTSCFTSGIDPGWANDLLPFVLTGACEYIDELRVMEVVNYATYAQPTVLFDTMGFGQALDSNPLLLLPGVLSLAWGGVVKVLAAGLGVEIEELREVHERRPAPRHRPRLRCRRGGHDRGDALRGPRHRERGSAHRPRARDPPRRRSLPRLAATDRRERLPRDRHRQPHLHVRRADDGRRRRPQHRRPRRHRRPAHQRDPGGVRGTPGLLSVLDLPLIPGAAPAWQPRRTRRSSASEESPRHNGMNSSTNNRRPLVSSQ